MHHLGTVLRSQMEKISQMERSSNNEISTGLLFWFWSDFTMSRSIIDDIGSAGGVMKSDVGATRSGSVLPMQDMLVSNQSSSSLWKQFHMF